MPSADPPRSPRSPRHLARLRLWSFAGLLLAGIASGAVHAGQTGSGFNVSVNYVAPGSGSCGLLAGPAGFGSVACASQAGAALVWFSGQALQDTNRLTDYALLPGPYRARGATNVFSPALSTWTQRVTFNGRDYIEMTLAW